MKFYTKKESNLVFTVNAGSSLDGLIEVDDVLATLSAKGLGWVQQLSEDCFSLVVYPAVDLTDPRISQVVDIAHDDELSADCSEVLSI